MCVIEVVFAVKTEEPAIASDIATVFSTVIAFLSVIVIAWQLAVQRRHNRLSVTPRLVGEIHSFKHGDYKWELVNRGVGPAIVESFSFSCEGSLLESPTTQAIEERLKQYGFSKIVGSGDLRSGDYISPGEVFLLLEIPQRSAFWVKDTLMNTKWNVTYKCIYGSKYTVEFKI